MNKKNIFRTLSVAAFSAVMFTSCNNSAPKMDEKQDAAQPAGTTDMKIAFVEVDSIMSQYKFCKEYSIELQKKSNNCLQKKNNFRQQRQTSSRNSKIMASAADRRPRAYRLQSNVRDRLFRNCRIVWALSSTPRLPSLTQLFATLYRTSSRIITRQRSTTSSSQRLATTFSMPTSVTTSPWTSSMA